MTITLDLVEAIRRHESGDWKSAQTVYRQILETDPENAEVLHLFGMSQFAGGNAAQAVDSIQRAITIDPKKVFFYTNLATVFHAQKDFQAAEKCCRQATAIDPSNYEAWNNLGGILTVAGKKAEAEEALRRAIELHGHAPQPFFNLGNLLIEKRDWAGAAEAFESGLRVDPENVDAHFNMGVALLALNRSEESIPYFQHCIAKRPENPHAFYNLGMAATKTKRHAQAMQLLERCLELKPDYPEALCLLGVSYLKFRRRDEAERCFREALAGNPRLALCCNGLSLIERSNGNWDRGMELCLQALEIEPDCAPAHFNLACQLLVQGDFARGWKEYKWIRRCPGVSPEKFNSGTWDGGPVEGKTVVIRAEQGFGDTIQFVRYATLLKARGAAQVIVECQKPLQRLLRKAAGVDRVIPQGNSLPKDAIKTPALDLPAIFDTHLDTIPGPVPYLFPDTEIPEPIRKAIETTRGLRVGLAWQGNPDHADDDARSLPWEHLRTLARVPNTHFFSFQKGHGAETVPLLAKHLLLTDLGSLVGDFADSARAIQQMDLMIAVDTSVVHLAGALGKTTWLMVPFIPEWRWMRDRDDSPWYPSMKIFRQKSLGDWTGVVEEIAAALEKRVAASKGHAS